MKIGFLGLGTMGQPMALRLAGAGHEVLGWNRTRARLEGPGLGSIVPVATPAEACQAELLISMVSDDEALRTILYQEGRLVSAGVPGLVHLCMATVSDRLALELADAHARLDQAYVSAPVFGAPEAAKAGRLVIPVSGPESAYQRVRPVLDVLGRPAYLAADPAAAAIVKAAGSFLMASVVESLRDATTLVHAAGVDPREFTGIVTQALFPTPVYQYLGGMLANREALQGVRVPNPFVKAARQCADTASRLGIAVPTIEHVRNRGQEG
jgi:3-hydroxyisobutyrate dehydrogenase-like beta-hydroxyacid dehydrogenase